MSQIWRGVSGGIEVLENVNEMADLPDISTIDSEGVWYIESGEFGPDYIAPTNWDSSAGEFTDWFSLFDGQILVDIPDGLVDDFEDESINVRSDDWSGWDGDTDKFSVQSDTVLNGDFSARLEGSTRGLVTATKNTSYKPNEVHHLLSADGQSGTDTDGMHSILKYGGDVFSRIRFDYAGTIRSFTQSNLGEASWSANIIYKIRYYNFDFDNDTLSVEITNYEDGSTVLQSDGVTFENSVPEFDSIEFFNKDDDDSGVDNFYDDVFAT